MARMIVTSASEMRKSSGPVGFKLDIRNLLGVRNKQVTLGVEETNAINWMIWRKPDLSEEFFFV